MPPMPNIGADSAISHELFVHVRSVIGVLLGLSIGRLLQGIATLIEHPRQQKIWWVHLGWVAWALLLVISFWWWEYHLSLITDWTILKYIFLFAYAGLYFLMCSILFPSSMEDYSGYQDYFLSRRCWFFGFLIAITLFDLVDTVLKGSAYAMIQGVGYLLHAALLLFIAIAGIVASKPSTQATILSIALITQVLWTFHAYDRLI